MSIHCCTSFRIWYVAILLIALSGCGPKEEVETTVPFDLPPQDSFLLKFDAIVDPDTKAITDSLSYYDYSNAPISKITQDYTDSLPVNTAQSGISNQAFAGLHVFGWSVLTLIGMAIPTATFVEAFNHTPTPIGNGKWQWAYSANVLLKTYDARLVGSIVNDQVVWEMYISRRDGEFSDVNWYSGTHNIAATSGSWTLRQRNDTTGVISDFIQIDWERDLIAGSRNIRYTNLDDNGYIENGISTATDYDAYFNIDNKAEPIALINIEWNSTDNNGRVRSNNTTSQAHFGHTDWNCWDTALTDVTCSQ